MHTNLLVLGLGALLLIVGRKLFWLVVGVLGFVSGIELVPQVIHDGSRLTILTVAIAMGVLGALLAVFLQYLAVGIAGFIAGVHLIPAFLSLLNFQINRYMWVFSLVAGFIFAILALVLLNWALIMLSSLVGASLVCQALMLGKTAAALVFVILVVAGVMLQSNHFRRQQTVT
jgi:hypothetical protein